MGKIKELKKVLSAWKDHRLALPRLIECSRVYGDKYYTAEDIMWADKRIAELEKQIKSEAP